MSRRLASLAVLATILVAGASDARDRIAIRGLDGLDLGRWTGHGDLTGDDPHCVQVVGGGGPPTFNLEAFGEGPGGAFTLTNGGADLPFRAHYDDGRGTHELVAGRILTGLRGIPSEQAFRRCERGEAGQRNRIEVRVGETDLAAAPAGRFVGRIHLMVLPE